MTGRRAAGLRGNGGAEKEPATVEAVLEQTSVFARLEASTRQRIAEALRPVEVAGDKVLFRSGAAGEGCYLVEQGVLSVAIEDRNGSETWLAVLGRGDLVGELCLIDRAPRSATVTAMTDCRLWLLRARDFEGIAADDPDVYRAIARLVSQRLRVTNQQVCDQRLGLEARLALVMLRLADAFGERLADGRTLIRYRIRQTRLAEAAAASRENVNRQFQVWRKAGLCDKVGSYYCLSPAAEWDDLRADGVAFMTG